VKITLDDSKHFSDSCYVSDLPFEEPTAEIILPEIPLTHTETNFNGDVRSIVEITEISYETQYLSYNDSVAVKLYVSGEKTYIGESFSFRHRVPYRILDSDGAVIDTRTFFVPELSAGERFARAEILITGLTVDGTYTIEIRGGDSDGDDDTEDADGSDE
jgi:hypothetical protein